MAKSKGSIPQTNPRRKREGSSPVVSALRSARSFFRQKTTILFPRDSLCIKLELITRWPTTPARASRHLGFHVTSDEGTGGKENLLFFPPSPQHFPLSQSSKPLGIRYTRRRSLFRQGMSCNIETETLPKLDAKNYRIFLDNIGLI